MKKITTLLFVVVLTNIHAQITFPAKGADWHYMIHNGGFSSPDYYTNIEAKYVRDTIIDGRTAAIITNGNYFSFPDFSGTDYMYSSNDSVFVYNQFTLNTWQLLYDFNASVGQNWLYKTKAASYMQPFNTDTATYVWNIRVDSVKKIFINGDSLKKFSITYSLSSPPQYSLTLSSAVIEHIGGTQALVYIPDYFSYMVCDGCSYYCGLLCYQDSTFTLYQPDSTKNCNYYTYGIKQFSANSNQILVYPNPASSVIQVTVNNEQLAEIKMYDVLGNEIYPPLNPLQEWEFIKIDVSTLQNGVYFIHVKTAEGTVRKKVIVQH